MSYDYSENILVQESAGNLLRDELQWDVKFAYNTHLRQEIVQRDSACAIFPCCPEKAQSLDHRGTDT